MQTNSVPYCLRRSLITPSFELVNDMENWTMGDRGKWMPKSTLDRAESSQQWRARGLEFNMGPCLSVVGAEPSRKKRI